MLLTRWLFPSRCPICSQLIESNRPTCEECAKYLQVYSHKQVLMNNCICASAFRHEGVWRKAVINYKFQANRQYYVQFSIILSRVVYEQFNGNHFDLYTSVPLHKAKRMNRGFDQVKLIAKETARLNHTKYISLLTQKRPNRIQHTLSRDDRIENVKGIYSCKSKELLKGKSILLFDDIVTTGSTLLECSNILLSGGATSVCCITINW